MVLFQRILLPVVFVFWFAMAPAQQPANDFTLLVLNEKAQPLVAATVELLRNKELVKAAITDLKGAATFIDIAAGDYIFSITSTGYKNQLTEIFRFPSSLKTAKVQLQVTGTALAGVTVLSKKPFIQHAGGKTVVNVDASVTNAGTTVLEVLEKSPGVMVDRNGGISLQGKPGVLVLIDDKPTYLSGADLNNLLGSMNASQVEQIELMTSPPAKYEASGNAGIINIKTKKNKAKGFNGSFTLTPGQGVYSKLNGSLVLNYRSGRFNTFFNYGMNYINYYSEIYALRKYYDDDGKVSSILDQPTYFAGNFGNNNLKTGLDYYITSKTTLGIVLGGMLIGRSGTGNAAATWIDATGATDSSIATTSSSNNHFKNGSVNVNLRHVIDKRQEFSVDLDWLDYSLASGQQFNNHLQIPGGYNEASTGKIPSNIRIASAKADHVFRFGKNYELLSGFKTSGVNTDNSASYQNFDGVNWQEDYDKSNRFLYRENINAFYASVENKRQRVSFQAGLRYEATRYDASQLGNNIQKDSSFNRHYDGLFPSGYFSYKVDSANTLTVTAGRRIDRPAFQNLNPFTYIINKYTYQSGNPFIVPQYSWNLELSHQYREWLTTTLSYSVIKNYFSQLFLTDTITGLLYYSQGNVGRAQSIGLGTTVMLTPLKWWSFTLDATYHYKELKGYNGDVNLKTDINQLHVNLSNQFTIAKKFNGEISGFYTTRARNDLQERLYPTGQLSLGISAPVLKKKGTLKLGIRDLFYTNAMEGLTQFSRSTEYFIVRRDSRVLNLSLVYRFGKAYKTSKRNSGSAADEMERVGSG